MEQGQSGDTRGKEKKRKKNQQEKTANKHTFQVRQTQAALPLPLPLSFTRTHAQTHAKFTHTKHPRTRSAGLDFQSKTTKQSKPWGQGGQTLCEEGPSETLPLTLY